MITRKSLLIAWPIITVPFKLAADNSLPCALARNGHVPD